MSRSASTCAMAALALFLATAAPADNTPPPSEGLATPLELSRGNIIQLKNVVVTVQGKAEIEDKDTSFLVRFKNADGRTLVVASIPRTAGVKPGVQTVAVSGRVTGRGFSGVTIADATLTAPDKVPALKLDEAIQEASDNLKAAKELKALQDEMTAREAKSKEAAARTAALTSRGYRIARDTYHAKVKDSPNNKLTEREFIDGAMRIFRGHLRKEGFTEDRVKFMMAIYFAKPED